MSEKLLTHKVSLFETESISKQFHCIHRKRVRCNLFVQPWNLFSLVIFLILVIALFLPNVVLLVLGVDELARMLAFHPGVFILHPHVDPVAHHEGREENERLVLDPPGQVADPVELRLELEGRLLKGGDGEDYDAFGPPPRCFKLQAAPEQRCQFHIYKS